MNLINNIDYRLADDLKNKIKRGSKVAVAAASFSIYSFDALRKELNDVEELRFIFTSPVFMKENLKKDFPRFFIPHLYKEADLCGGDFELRLRNRLTQRAIARECSRWVKEKVTFKSNKRYDHPMPGMIVTQNNDKSEYVWNNINGFTTADLGLTYKSDFPVLIQRSDYPTSKSYLEFFNGIWENNELLEDVTDKVLNYFEKAFKENSPEYIYFITLYNIFNDFLINYDIHWNPVRIIQRFGRIDRIGSINESITLVNFWPDITLDQYINLKQRVEDRMLISVLTGTTHDNLLKEKEEDLVYRKIQLKQLQENVSDMEELREGVDITDLGLSDFRVDLSNFIKTYGEMSSIPSGLHAVVPATKSLKPGVLFVLKNINESVNTNNLNRLHPFYLLYIDNDGEPVFTHLDSKKTLDAMRMFSKGRKEPLQKLCDEVSQKTDDYHNMDKYSELLKKAIGTILNVDEEKTTNSLFTAGGTFTSDSKFKGIEDFELISFLIIS